MQKMKSNFDNLYEAEKNVVLGVYYLKIQRKIYNNNTMMTLAAYHAGRENVRRWIKQCNTYKPLLEIKTCIML